MSEWIDGVEMESDEERLAKMTELYNPTPLRIPSNKERQAKALERIATALEKLCQTT